MRYLVLLSLIQFTLLRAVAQPTAPTGVIAQSGPRIIALSWNTVTGINIRYQIYRGLTTGNLSLYVDSVGSTSYTDTGAVAGTRYYYYVRSFNASGYSPNSALVSQVSNRIWYVANNGSNFNSGSETSPFLTILSSIAKVPDGDTILLLPGTYSERINLTGRGIVIGSKYLTTFDTSYISNTKIDGSGVVSTGSLIFDNNTTSNYGIKALVGLTITHSKLVAIDLSTAILRRLIIEENATGTMPVSTSLIYLYNAVTFDSSIIRNNTNPDQSLVVVHYGYLAGSATVFNFKNNQVNNNNGTTGILSLPVVSSSISFSYFIDNNRFSKNTGFWYTGVISYGDNSTNLSPQKLYLRNNIISKNERRAMYLFSRSGDTIQVINNTITENQAGIEIQAVNAAFTRIINNVITLNGYSNLGYIPVQNIIVSGTPLFPIHRVVIKNNVLNLTSNVSPFNFITNYDYLNIVDSSDNINANPAFSDTTSSMVDYHLKNQSLIIGKGMVDPWMPAVDISGSPRPFPAGSNPDPGAYENSFAVSSPQLLQLGVDSVGITPVWHTDSIGVANYIVYRDTSSTPTTILATISGNKFQFKDTSVIPQRLYYYRVVAVNHQGLKSAYSNTLSGRVLSIPDLISPANLSNNQPRQLIFKWIKNPFATAYRIQISKSSNFGTGQVITDTTISDTQFATAGFSYNADYFWRVRSKDSIASGNWSQSHSFQTELRIPSITSVSTNGNLVTINWTDSASSNVLRYRIYRTTIPGLPILIDSVNSGYTSYTDQQVQSNTLYSYAVVALNNQLVTSLFGIERKAIPLGIVSPEFPANNSLSASRTPIMYWQKN